jgi:hypothetical protein
MLQIDDYEQCIQPIASIWPYLGKRLWVKNESVI